MRESTWLYVVLALLLLGGGGVIVYTQTRGLRNNNPGNIRRTESEAKNPWQGEAPQQTDAEFVQFTSPVYGIRAMTIILQGYRASGRNTIRRIITRWAPSNENDVEAYVADVADYTGLDPDQALTDADMAGVVQGIIHHENGTQPYDASVISQGLSLAGVAYA